MPKLGHLNLDNETVKALASCKIHSISDFIEADVEKIVSSSQLDPGACLTLQHKFINDYSAKPCNALDWYIAQKNERIIETGINCLDSLLDGGLKRNCILELCGVSGSGKTQICISLTIQAAVTGAKVEYIDTKLDFSATRCNLLLPTNFSDWKMDAALENITVSTPKNMYELISKIYSLKSKFEKSPGEDRVVIVDSLTVPNLSFIGISSNKGLSLLNHVASSLKLLSMYCAVVVTNLGAIYFEIDDENQLKKSSKEIKPMLGKYWVHVPDTRILINREGASSIRTLTIVKSCSLQINKTTQINISEKGVN